MKKGVNFFAFEEEFRGLSERRSLGCKEDCKIG